MADHVSDFTQSEEKIVIDLINFDNETNLTLEQISFGAPVPNEDTVDLLISPLPESGYKDTVVVSYHRLDIQQFMDIYFPDGLMLQAGDALTIAELLPEINVALGTAIPLSSIIDAAIGAWPGEANEAKDLILQIAPDSRVYQGNASFKLDGLDISLDSAISIKILSGLNLPEGGVVTPTPTGFTRYRLTEDASSRDLVLGFEAQDYDSGDYFEREPNGVVAFYNNEEHGWDPETGLLTIPAGNRTFGISNRTGGYLNGWTENGSLELEGITEFQNDGHPWVNFTKTESFVEAPAYLPPNVLYLSLMFENAYVFNQDISGWNTSNVKDMYAMFAGARAFNRSLNTWNISSVQMFGLEGVFRGAHVFNQPLDTWNTSNIASLGSLFEEAYAFNQDLSAWDTSKVENMSHTFFNATAFNGNIGTWDVSSVQAMNRMFQNATAFNKSVENWDVSAVTNMRNMFDGASAFNQPMPAWNAGSVIDMGFMFHGASSFNQSLADWNVSNVTDMEEMFRDAVAFNGSLANWDVSNVIDFFGMFHGATAFNGDVDSWTPTSGQGFSDMFFQATAFNRDISGWDVGAATSMSQMFREAVVFNQDLSGWNVPNVSVHGNFDLDAVGWMLPRPEFSS